ncbi:protein of unknown function [Hyphomicrobium sp. 1Nfss2.1]|uniref:hypothetical protein n=1 Tax=Hyphomicrobium sp. 1Nfss2.1 TaxID=3413936 RepID=UPI003C7DAF2F
MSIYRKADGSEIIICDGCGIAEDDTRPDLATLMKVDVTAEAVAAGMPSGIMIGIIDHCPDCQVRKPDSEVR